MDEIKVSVIVPVYNTEKYLNQCLDSIVNQTLKEIEIILVNDESKDNSLNILEQYKKKDKRIKIINNKHEGEGAASARNAGLRIAKGEYLAFLDSDDFFEIDLLEKTYNRGLETKSDIVVYNGMLYDQIIEGKIDTDTILDITKVPEKKIFSYKDALDTLFLCTTPAPWNKLFKADLVRKYKLEFQSVFYTDDVLFVLSSMVVAEKISVLNEKLVYYRINVSEAQTTNKAKAPFSIIYAYLALKDFLQYYGVFEELKNGYANRTIKDCAFYLNTIKDIDSFIKLYNALEKEYIKILELETSLSSSLLPWDAYTWIEKIKNNDLIDYGFLADGYIYNDLFFKYSTNKLFPENLVEKNDNIILYGAGKIGMALYIQNVLENRCNIVAWVDKNYLNKPFPVEGVECLEDSNIKNNTKILIAIENKAVAKKVELFLLNTGWEKNKILINFLGN